MKKIIILSMVIFGLFSAGYIYAYACYSNSDCGTNGYTGSPFCQSGNVYQSYITHTCNNPGTPSSTCSNATASQLKTTCSAGQTCSGGACTTITCSNHSYKQCLGSDLYWYDSCGNQQGMYQHCVNGCANNACLTSSCTNQSYKQCAGSDLYWYDSCGNQQGMYQHCVNGCANNACLTSSCTNHSYKQCTGGGLYWYDSCGNQQGIYQYCPNGCSDNSCIINNCTNNSYKQCVGNNLYWYDSCSNQQSIYQYCSNGCSGNSCQSTTGTLTVTKTVRNLTKSSGFLNSTYANPSDMLMFMITIQSPNQDAQNVLVKDVLPVNLIYNNQLVVARSNNASNNYSGDVLSGINLNTISSGQIVTITYQAQVAPAANFSYGTTTLNNNVNVTSSSYGNLTALASVIVTRSTVLGASTISTGLTNNFWLDSFLLPLIIALVAIVMWRSGVFFGIEKWFDNKKKIRKTYKSEKELSSRIVEIKKTGGI